LATREYIPSLDRMIESDALSAMIADAQQVPVTPPAAPTIDLTVPKPRADIRIPESTAVLLLDYELYV
jgi:hypothetical protein